MSSVWKLNALIEGILMQINGRFIVALVFAVLLTSQFLLAEPPAATKPGQPPTTKPAGTPSVGEQLGKKKLPEVKLDGIGLSDAADFLRDVTEANLFIDWSSLEKAGVDQNTPVSVRLIDQLAVDAIRQTFAAAAAKDGTRPAQVSFEGRYIYVGTQESIRNWQRQNAQLTKLIADKPAAAKVLNKKLPEVKFDNISLGDAVDFLQDVVGAPIKPNWKVLEKLKITRDQPVSTRLYNLTVGDALITMFKSETEGSNVTFSWDGKALVISAAK